MILVAIAAGCRADSVLDPDPPIQPDSAVKPAPTLRLEAVSPKELQGVVGTPVGTPTVVVRDGSGRPVQGILVTFRIDQSASSAVAPSGAVTNANGIAAAGVWVLGTKAGPQTLTAVIRESTVAVTFRAQALPERPVQVTGSAFPFAFPNDTLLNTMARVTDRFGNGVPGIRLVFTLTAGGGTLERREGTTSEVGFAAMGTWILGPVTGRNAVSIQVLDVEPEIEPAALGVVTLDPGRFVWYDLETINGMTPQSVGVERAYVALGDSGLLIEEITGTPNYELAGRWRGAGTYEVFGSSVHLAHRSELFEMNEAAIDAQSFQVQRADPYTYHCCVTWRYKKRASITPSPP